ncbi:MAG: hypothetical protein M0R70_12655 [Nitrospirae bacterium]|nr:hypothetical protein [Nitrospirota bacterium]
MPKYTVVDGHKKYNGKTYAPGDQIETTPDIAAQLRLVPVEDAPPADLPKKISADEAIAAIGKCATVEEVKAFFTNEDRVTVKDAAKAKIKELNAAAKAAEKK